LENSTNENEKALLPAGENNNTLLPVSSDFVFKLIFGDARNIDVLAEFLKSVLRLSEDEYSHLTIIDPHVKKESEDDKYGILDVKAHTKNKKVIHIEIQLKIFKEMQARVIFGQSKMVTEQIKSGQGYSVIKPVISIIIAGENFVQDDNEANNTRYHYQFRHRTEDGIEFTDLIETNVLELSKLPTNEEDTDLWYWMKFIKSDDKEVLNMIAERSPQMKKAVGVLKELSADERTRMLYEAREMARMDGEARVRDGIIGVAKNFLNLGLPTEQIAAGTGLTYDEIESLRT